MAGLLGISTYSVALAPMVCGGPGHRRRHRHPAAPHRLPGRELALLKTFADQAVIAIQNARMFRETQDAPEAADRQRQVLNVIGHSMADAGPVFEKILELRAAGRL